MSIGVFSKDLDFDAANCRRLVALDVSCCITDLARRPPLEDEQLTLFCVALCYL